MVENLAGHLAHLGAGAPDPVSPGPLGPANRKVQWLDRELGRLAEAYDLRQDG